MRSMSVVLHSIHLHLHTVIEGYIPQRNRQKPIGMATNSRQGQMCQKCLNQQVIELKKKSKTKLRFWQHYFYYYIFLFPSLCLRCLDLNRSHFYMDVQLFTTIQYSNLKSMPDRFGNVVVYYQYFTVTTNNGTGITIN